MRMYDSKSSLNKRVGTTRKSVDQKNPINGHRPVGFVLLGVLLLSIAGWFVYHILHARTVDTINSPAVYEYKVNQQFEAADWVSRKSLL